MNELLLFKCWVSKCTATTHVLISDRRDHYCYGCFEHGIDIIRFVQRFGSIPPQYISEEDLKDLRQGIAFKDVESQPGATE